MELLLRFLAEEVYFFVGRHWKWNLFDLTIVLSSAVEILSNFSGPNLKFMRVLRPLRVIRSIK
eukprot:CAMPEP_0171130810 /NCGR_PEP_ID=MMETSP0766_2-20121228/121578_1 /TAXON_ID=439317 /ORGANISM="Gambierdiscus australes, Strain CAWD 149" /LENGTH=62 /DNA_ID=CAMNT_0011594071 /DNA_START=1 /DNA_END=186 /DNA_ORIENTATION=+